MMKLAAIVCAGARHLGMVSVALLAMLAACSDEPASANGAGTGAAPDLGLPEPARLAARSGQAAGKTAAGTGGAAAAAASGPAGAGSGRAQAVAESTDLYEFSWDWPSEADAIPALRERFVRDRAKDRASLIATARDDRNAASEQGYNYNPHSLSVSWKRVANLPRFLSLSADIATYTGGAHGMYGFDSLVWDREANRALEPSDLFLSVDALRGAIQPRFCNLLDRERSKRRGEPVNRDSGSEFDECIDPTESTVLLGSSNGRQFNRMAVLVGPYAAGSYAEGSYEIDLPVTRAVIAAVKPGYRGAFAITP